MDQIHSKLFSAMTENTIKLLHPKLILANIELLGALNYTFSDGMTNCRDQTVAEQTGQEMPQVPAAYKGAGRRSSSSSSSLCRPCRFTSLLRPYPRSPFFGFYTLILACKSLLHRSQLTLSCALGLCPFTIYTSALALNCPLHRSQFTLGCSSGLDFCALSLLRCLGLRFQNFRCATTSTYDFRIAGLPSGGILSLNFQQSTLRTDDLTRRCQPAGNRRLLSIRDLIYSLGLLIQYFINATIGAHHLRSAGLPGSRGFSLDLQQSTLRTNALERSRLLTLGCSSLDTSRVFRCGYGCALQLVCCLLQSLQRSIDLVDRPRGLINNTQRCLFDKASHSFRLAARQSDAKPLLLIMDFDEVADTESKLTNCQQSQIAG